MAPRVPYSPVPETSPSKQATPTTQLQAKDAFGKSIEGGLNRLADGMTRMAQGADAYARGTERLAAGVGEVATGHEKIARGEEKLAAGQGAFGRALEGAGTEIFGRAVAMQNVVNDADARQAQTDYTMKANELFVQHQSLQGKQAVEALPAFRQNLVKMREEARATLKNPMAQKIFDGESMGTMTRTMFAGAAHSATGAKQYDIQTREARLMLNTDGPFIDYRDPVEYATRQNATVADAIELAAAKYGTDPSDHSDPINHSAVLIATSRQRSTWLTNLAREQPFEAAKLFEEHKKELTIPDAQKVEQVIRTQSRAVGAAGLGRQVFLEGQPTDKKAGWSIQEMEEEVRKRADKLDPNDPLLASHAVAALRQNWNQQKYAQNLEQRQNQQIVQTAIQSGMSEQQMLADPKVSKAIADLPATDPLKKTPLNKTVQRYDEARNHDEMKDNYNRLVGMAKNGDVIGFLDVDIPSQKLTGEDKQKLLTLRGQLVQNPQNDPRVGMFWRLMRQNMTAQLGSMDLLARKPKNEEQFDLLQGAISGSIEAFQSVNQRPPTAQEFLKDIAPVIIRQQATGKYWFQSQAPRFDVDTYSKDFKEFSETYILNEKNHGRPVPPEAEVIRQYQSMDYQRLFGKKKETQ